MKPIVIYAFFGSLCLLGCKSHETRVENPGNAFEKPALAGSMQNLKLAMEKLLPRVVDSKVFSDPATHKELAAEIANLSEISKKISRNPVKEKMDPSFTFLSEAFSAEVGRASEAFEGGKTEFARYSLLNVTSYCIECHTRTSSGPSFSHQELNAKLSQLKPLERGEFLLATRQFDAALDEFIQLIHAGPDRYQFIELDRALRYALAITVKFQNDPTKTERVIQKLKSESQIPYFLKQVLPAWTTAVNEWKAEIKKNKDGSQSADERIAQAESLIKRGRQEQTGFSERAGDIYILRGLSLLHQVLNSGSNPNQLGHSLFLTGTAYEAVRDAVTWSLQDSYFESCVRRVPHSNWALNCYKSLEESVATGFSGSQGTRIPYDVQLKLSELEKLAQPEIPEKK